MVFHGTNIEVFCRVNSNYDTVVIGGGQGASLAHMLAEGGHRVALVEKRFVGGSCTNIGCTPTKSHIAAAKVAYTLRNSGQFGISANLKEIDLGVVVNRTKRIVEDFRHEIEERLLNTPQLQLIYGLARFLSPSEVEVILGNGTTHHLTATNFVIAVGTQPKIPIIEGLDEVPFMTSEEALHLEKAPKNLLILGGGYIACEFAQMFARFGTEVTMIQNRAHLLTREDQDISQAVAKILEDSGVNVVLDAELARVEPFSNGVKAHWKSRSGLFDKILMATGRTPQTSGWGIEKAQVKLNDEGYIEVNDSLQTTNRRIFALGDCKGGPEFTHIAHDDARILRDGLLHNQWRSINKRQVPYTVFIDPQLGRVGLTEREAQKQNKTFDVAYLEMKETARGIETGQESGIWKVLVEKPSGQILGGAFLSEQGGETMAVVQLAMQAGIPYTELRDGIFAHPTWAEALNNLFIQFDRNKKSKRTALCE